ncbi:MAG: adaptor protein MecA [Lachnospiraceae bacterium]|nr:adaptor protein MecA [Lachnospiraceae bacterium]
MKIEKINDRQIRCILTKEDLEDRKIRLSELVYGGEKARGLFRDMLVKAAEELGFDYNNNPLMVEAVPAGHEQLVLIITRVDDPEELDTRFSRFSADPNGGKDNAFASLADSLTGADDVLNLLKRFTQARGVQGGSSSGERKDGKEKDSGTQSIPNSRKGGRQNPDQKNAAPAAMRQLTEEEIYQYTRFYLFRSLENVILAAKGIGEGYEGENSLYKNPDDGAYYLLVRKMDTDPEQFNRICNVLSEYAMPMDYATGMDEFFREHMKVILSGTALQDLRKL